MPARDTQHGTGTGLVVIVASAAACVAIIAASAVVARKPPPREDFSALAPKDRERPLGPDLRADEEENAPAGEEPQPAELVARASKLIADGSRNRAQIEGLLLGAVKARPGTEESIEAFKLLRGLYREWHEEDSRRSVPGERTELPPPPRVPVPVEPPRATGKVVVYSEDFERGGGRWAVEPSWAPPRIKYKEPPRTVFDRERGGQVLKLGYTPQDTWHPRRAYDDQANVQVTPETRISFWYRTEGELSLVHAQHSFAGVEGAPRNYVYRLVPSRAWRHVDEPASSYSPLGEGTGRLEGTMTIRSARVYAGNAGERGECYIDDFVIYNPAPAAAPATPPLPVAPPSPTTPGFVSLIGTDLSNWGRPSAGTWKLEGGAILGDCLNTVGYLYTRRHFRDFTLKLKVTALATSETDPHLKVRFRWIPEKGLYGCQAELCRDAYFYGNVVDAKNCERLYRPSSDLSLSVGRSVDVELVVIGESVVMRVNGKEVFAETTKITEPGEMGLGAHRSSILFERVEIKEH